MTTATGPGLVIDVAAEIELLSRSMVQGAWQVPAEVARYALRRGAHAIEIERRGGTLVVAGHGGDPPLESLRRASVAADPARSDADRHVAAVGLEADGDLALLWALATDTPGVQITVASADGGFAARRDRGDRVVLRRVDAHPPGVFLEIDLPRRVLRQAVEWCRSAGRYASTPIRLDGHDLRGGIGEGSHRLRLGDPLASVVHLGTTGDGPSLRLLRHEILVTRATVPSYPSFVAAVELAGHAPENGSAADHRRAVTSHLPALVDRVVGGMLRLVDELPRMDRGLRTPIVRELLRAADRGLRMAEVRSAPLVEVLDARGRPEWRTLQDLQDWPRLPPVIDPQDLADRPHTGAVLVLDDVSRRTAEAITGRIWPVAAAAAPRRGVRGRVTAAGSAVRDVIRRLRFGRRDPVAPDRLAAAERRLQDALVRWALPPESPEPEVRWVAGADRPVARGAVLELGRDHPDVRRAVARLAVSDAWEPVVAHVLLPRHWDVQNIEGRG